MRAETVLDRVAGPLVLLVSLAVALMYLTGRHADADNAARDRAIVERTQAVAECQARFNAVVVANVKTRDRLRTGRDTAQEAVFARIGEVVVAAQVDAGPRRDAALRAAYARFRVAYSAYEVALLRLRKYSEANPLPPFPDCPAQAAREAAATASPTTPPT